MILERGLVQIYTGEGKGKTTAALGLALRAAGQGLRVFIIQFMKYSDDSGELKILPKLDPFCRIEHYGEKGWVNPKNPKEEDIQAALKGYKRAEEILADGQWDLVILDELVTCILFGLISEDNVLKLIRQKPDNLEIILTGHQASQRLMDCADLVTEMKPVKHPFDQGIQARRGIEY